MNNYSDYLMITFDIPNWENYITQYIDEEDLLPNEHKPEPHVTLLGKVYNEAKLHNIKKHLKPLHKIKVVFNKINIFEIDDADVVKFELHSNQLKEMNEVLRRYIAYQDTFVDYKPHITLAYVKKGTGKKYIKKLSKPFQLVPYQYKYSSVDNSNPEYFEITNEI